MSGNIKLATPSGGSVTLSSADTASNLTATVPAATDTLVNLNSTQTLTNKTLTSPVLSSPSAAGNLTFSTSNAGIVFNNSSALTNSTLNDYETGSWTPVFAAVGGSGVSFSYTYQQGLYTKIGNIVFVEANMIGTVTYSSTPSRYQIQGLPFTAVVASGNIYNAAVLFDNNTASNFVGRGSNGSAVIDQFYTSWSSSKQFNCGILYYYQANF